jgi:3-dehydroquinate dehydratase-2
VVEVHLSDIEGREEWRRRSVIADVVSHRILGKGPDGYHEALRHLVETAA